MNLINQKKRERQEAQCKKLKHNFQSIENLTISDLVNLNPVLFDKKIRSSRFLILKTEIKTENGVKPILIKCAYGKEYEKEAMEKEFAEITKNKQTSGKMFVPGSKFLDCYDFYFYEYEMEVYSKIVPKIIYYSPNFVQGKSFVIDREKDFNNFHFFFKKLQQNINKNAEENRLIEFKTKQNYLFEGCDKTKIYILVSEFIQDAREIEQKQTVLKDLGRLVLNFADVPTTKSVKMLNVFNVLNEDEIQKFVAQVILTLAVMSLFKFSHNDLHLGNLMIKRLDTPQNLSYYFGNDIYITIPNVTYSLFLFDWDRSYVEELGNNLGLNYTCENSDIRTCNGYRLVNDFVKFLFHLYQFCGISDPLKDFEENLSQSKKFVLFCEKHLPDVGRSKNLFSKTVNTVNNKENKVYFKDQDDSTAFFTRILKDEYIKEVLDV
jgi:hypothetical protein